MRFTRLRDWARWWFVCALAVLGVVMAQAAGGAPPATLWIVFSAYPDGSTSTAPQLFRIQTNGDGLQQLTTGKLPARRVLQTPLAF